LANDGFGRAGPARRLTLPNKEDSFPYDGDGCNGSGEERGPVLTDTLKAIGVAVAAQPATGYHLKSLVAAIVLLCSKWAFFHLGPNIAPKRRTFSVSLTELHRQ
jgi:hypothetical protein